MAKGFIIAGLPRTRTTWMTAFLSNYPVTCYHDPLINMSDFRQVVDRMDSSYYKYVGVADTAIGYFMPEVVEEIDVPILIIERDIDEVILSLNEIGQGKTVKHLYYMREQLEKVKGHPNVKWVNFNALNNANTMRKICYHLTPGVAFDEGRYKMFNDFIIVPNADKMRSDAESHKSQIEALMRDVIPKIKEYAPC